MKSNNKVLAIVQARYKSARLPGKVCKSIVKNKTLLELLIRRLSLSKKIDQIVVATTNDPLDKQIIKICNKIKIKTYLGSQDNVLKRYLGAAKKFKAKFIVRITSDCPLIDPQLVDKVINLFFQKNLDYCSNRHLGTYPDGLDVEVFNLKSLIFSNKKAKTKFDIEHVTPYMIKNNTFKKNYLYSKKNYSNLRWTVDEAVDLKVIKKIFEHFSPNIFFSWKDVLKLVKSKKIIITENKYLVRNEGSGLNSGQKLWRRAKSLIPGGNMFLSKRPEMYLPNQWPSYFTKSKGCTVKDLEGKSYYDLTMGVGTNILGYSHPEINRSIKKTIDNGTMSTLNCPEEVDLAQKLINIHPWADQAKFARTGGEANAVSIRIARTYAKNSKVAICGYHGWHDWYLAANLEKPNNLSEHLLPNLSTTGVPKNLKGTIFSFEYNNFEQLKRLVNKNNVGIIKMEVSRNYRPKNNFLKKVRELATQKKIVLIFDECTSGFRESFGGLHKNYNVNPDIAIFGKSLGNGHPITAIIGRKNIMDSSQSSFISSTYWSERLGYVAALKTLEIMEKTKSWEYIKKIGLMIKKNWIRLSKKHNLKIQVQGLDALANFNIISKNSLEYKTYIIQEMLKNGFITSNSIYVCINHNKKILKKYFLVLDKCFKNIKNCEKEKNIKSLLDGPTCFATFKRLN